MFRPDPDTPMSYPELREMSSRLFQANEGNPDVTSALAVAAALSMGLRSRERTGKGQYLETTMVGSCLYAESEDFIQYEGKPERRLPDRDLNGIHALYRSYRAADGWVFLACVTEREWAGLCEGLGRADLAGDARFSSPDARLEHDDDLAAELAGIFVSRPANAWESLLAEHGVACAEVFDGDLPTFANEQPVLQEAGLWGQDQPPVLGRLQPLRPLRPLFGDGEPDRADHLRRRAHPRVDARHRLLGRADSGADRGEGRDIIDPHGRPGRRFSALLGGEPGSSARMRSETAHDPAPSDGGGDE